MIEDASDDKQVTFSIGDRVRTLLNMPLLPFTPLSEETFRVVGFTHPIGDLIIQSDKTGRISVYGAAAVRHIQKQRGELKGFAVMFERGVVEYWTRNPGFLTDEQRDKIGLTGWMNFTIVVEEGRKG